MIIVTDNDNDYQLCKANNPKRGGAMFKHSKQRDMILEYLKGTKAHPTPEQVYDDLRLLHPELGIATVYRNLKTLHQQGLVRKLNVGEGKDRYDADTGNHYHFLCSECGGVSDLYEDDLEVVFKKDTGVTVHTQEIYFCGICKDCNSKKLN